MIRWAVQLGHLAGPGSGDLAQVTEKAEEKKDEKEAQEKPSQEKEVAKNAEAAFEVHAVFRCLPVFWLAVRTECGFDLLVVVILGLQVKFNLDEGLVSQDSLFRGF